MVPRLYSAALDLVAAKTNRRPGHACVRRFSTFRDGGEHRRFASIDSVSAAKLADRFVLLEHVISRGAPLVSNGSILCITHSEWIAPRTVAPPKRTSLDHSRHPHRLRHQKQAPETLLKGRPWSHRPNGSACVLLQISTPKMYFDLTSLAAPMPSTTRPTAFTLPRIFAPTAVLICPMVWSLGTSSSVPCIKVGFISRPEAQRAPLHVGTCARIRCALSRGVFSLTCREPWFPSKSHKAWQAHVNLD